MITDIYFVYNNLEDLNKFKGVSISGTPFIHYLDEGSHFEKSKAWKFKTEWGAKMTPFIALFNKCKCVKCFYSEASNDIINDLKEYINE